MFIVTECIYRDGDKMPHNSIPSYYMEEDDAFEDMSKRLHIDSLFARENVICLDYDYSLFETEKIDKIVGEYSYNSGWVRRDNFVYVVEIFKL